LEITVGETEQRVRARGRGRAGGGGETVSDFLFWRAKKLLFNRSPSGLGVWLKRGSSCPPPPLPLSRKSSSPGTLTQREEEEEDEAGQCPVSLAGGWHGLCLLTQEPWGH